MQEILSPQMSRWFELLYQEDYPQTTKDQWPELDIRTPEELSPTKKYIETTVLPKLAQNFCRYRRAIAHLLPFVDSRKLDPQTRKSIGLPGVPSSSPETTNLPNLYIPMDRNKGRNWQCDESEWRLLDCHVRLEGCAYRPPQGYSPSGAYWSENIAFDLLGCLALKLSIYSFGLCYQTKEFPNGTVFVHDMWYCPRRSHALEEKLRNLSNIAYRMQDSNHKTLYINSLEPKVSRDLVVWENCGGTWEPTRGLHQQSDPIPTAFC